MDKLEASPQESELIQERKDANQEYSEKHSEFVNQVDNALFDYWLNYDDVNNAFKKSPDELKDLFYNEKLLGNDIPEPIKNSIITYLKKKDHLIKTTHNELMKIDEDILFNNEEENISALTSRWIKNPKDWSDYTIMDDVVANYRQVIDSLEQVKDLSQTEAKLLDRLKRYREHRSNRR